MYSTRNRLTAATRLPLAALAILAVTMTACAKHDASTPASAGDSASASGASTSASAASATAAPTMPTDITPVRGTIASVSDTMLTVTTAAGDVNVAVEAPLHVFQRAKSDLAHVTAKSFIGVTSVKQKDGSELATEIHVFPEELRGTGEGSYMMTPPGAKDSAKSTMTNGTVKSSPASGNASRMTNGAVASNDAGKLTVDYHGGTQTITVPSDVSVTALAPAAAKLAKGAKVVVLAKKGADGSMKASSVVLAGEPAK